MMPATLKRMSRTTAATTTTVMRRVVLQRCGFWRGAFQLGSFSWSWSCAAERFMRMDCGAPSVPRVRSSPLVSRWASGSFMASPSDDAGYPEQDDGLAPPARSSRERAFLVPYYAWERARTCLLY